MATTKRVGRRFTAPQPSQKNVLSIGELKIAARAVLKKRLVEACHVNGRSLSSEMENRLEASFQGDDVFGGTQAAAFWRAIASAAVAEIGQDWMRYPSDVLGVAELAERYFKALARRFDDLAWGLAIVNRALDAFERTGDPNSLKIARQCIDFCDTAPEPKQRGLLPARDRLRDVVAGYESLWADYHRETGHELLDPTILRLIAARTMPDRAVASKPEPEPLGGEPRDSDMSTSDAMWIAGAANARIRLKVNNPNDEEIAEVCADMRLFEGLDLPLLPRPITADAILKHRRAFDRIREQAVVSPSLRREEPALPESADPAKADR